MRLRSTHLLPYACAVATILGCSSNGVLGSLARETADASADAGADTPLTPSITPLAAGGASTCVKTAQEQERCWGENSTGSLGLGDIDPASSATPVAPTPLGKVQALAAGETAQCALMLDGTLSCWGDMFIGDFNSTPIDHAPTVSPLSFGVTGPIARIAVGRYFTCLLGPSGDVRCFGLNDHGQLGLGSTSKTYLPTSVTGFDGVVTSISASMGGLFTCATTAPGSVYCWGDTGAGGIVPDPGDTLVPTKVEGFADGERAVEVVAGRSHACVRLATGNVKCWGNSDFGQLGDGLLVSSTTPVDTLYLTDVVTLAAGAEHTCAVLGEGTVFCWGNDDKGQVGGSPDPTRPLLVKPAFGAKFVSCGLAHSCAWATGGHVSCWGADASSQLGPRDATF